MTTSLDLEIKRAFDELVAAAPPPPRFGATPAESAHRRNDSSRRLMAIAAAVITVFGGVAALGALGDRPTTSEPAPIDLPQSTSGATSPTNEAQADIAVTPDTRPSVLVERSELAGADYEVVATPALPAATQPVDTDIDAFDGVYFAFLHEGPLPQPSQSLRFDVVQIFSGQDCLDRFGSEADAVCTPIGIDIDAPTAQVDIDVIDVPVSVRDANSDLNYRISGVELRSLFSGNPPAATAPAGFAFSSGFGFLLTYDNGTIVSIDQPA